MVGEIRVGAGDGLKAGQFFGLKGLPVGGEDEFGAGFCRGRAGAQGLEGFAHGATGFVWFAHRDMDVVALEHATGQIRSVVVA